MENSTEAPKKLEESCHVIQTPTPGQITGENSNWKRYVNPNIHSSTIYNS